MTELLFPYMYQQTVYLGFWTIGSTEGSTLLVKLTLTIFPIFTLASIKLNLNNLNYFRSAHFSHFLHLRPHYTFKSVHLSGMWILHAPFGKGYLSLLSVIRSNVLHFLKEYIPTHTHTYI